MGENSSAWEPWGDGLPNQREVAVDQSQDAEADHPDGKRVSMQAAGFGSSNCNLLKSQIHVNQSTCIPRNQLPSSSATLIARRCLYGGPTIDSARPLVGSRLRLCDSRATRCCGRRKSTPVHRLSGRRLGRFRLPATSFA